ncbi:hypothetical protein [Chryseolinea soli]|uniref:Uncharacterized protein n=1 Tax=Chryseolinea soli TaxID=2321403 RepID=A0A385SNT2_9BACT|nr:hypothetical protein [Chryseolinea soli]AYB32176.1 hypothetical protein D4L85_17065 [Chryseolinea soli]
MKKHTLILIILFAFALSSQAQQEASRDGKKENQEFTVPKNKTAINEALEDIKVKIAKADAKISGFKAYGRSLENLKTRLSSYEPNSIDQILKDIESAITAKSNDDIYSQEETLIANLNIFSFEYSVRFYSFGTGADDDFSSDFFKESSEITKPIKSELLRSIENNHESDNNKVILNSQEKLTKLKSVLNAKNLSDIKARLTTRVDTELAVNKTNIENTETEIKTAKTNKAKLLDQLDEQETQINDLAIKLGLPLFCLTILLLFLGPKILIAIKKTAINIGQGDEASQNVLLEIGTVLLLTMSILILGLSGKIQSDVLGTLIGGISGYVLNRIRAKQ